MNDQQPDIPPEAMQEAKRNPGGWVYQIEGDYGPNDAIPPEDIVGGCVLLAVMLAAEKAETSREIPSRLFLVDFAEMLVLLPFPVGLRDDTPVTLDP
jgi:hypothetical protein